MAVPHVNILSENVGRYKSFRLFYFSPCYPPKPELRYDTTEGGIGYSGKLEKIGLPVDRRLLIDRYVSEQNALGSRYGMLAYLLGFSDCRAMFLGKCLPTEAKEMTAEL